jgi:hypothetical protein
MHLRTAFGVVELAVWRGQDPVDGRWGIPMRERWGLTPHQQLSPALEDKLAYFATVTGSYEAAAKLSAKVGCPVEDSTIQVLVQRLGAKAEAQTQQRLQTPPVEKAPARAPTPLAVLMVDGFQVRFRGPGWGKQETPEPRVEWHEVKLGVFYRHEQAVGEARGQLLEKVMVGWQGDERRTCWRWATGRRGFGTSWRIAGGKRISCWTSTTPASISGRWAKPSAPKTNRPDAGGSRPDCTACGMGRSRPCCGNWRRCPAAGVRRGK